MNSAPDGLLSNRRFSREARYLIGADERTVPVWEGRRLRWIEEALRPLRKQLTRAGLAKLRDAFALAWSTEAVMVTRDVCQLEPMAAVKTVRTAARYLVVGALAEMDSR